MKLEDELMTDRGQVVGFGRVKIPTIPAIHFNIDIPLFSFVVIERDEKHLRYIASCIQLPIDGYGDTIKSARFEMVIKISSLLYENFKDSKCRKNFWETLYLFSKSNPNSNLLWDKYHAIQYLCAKDGVPTDDYSKLRKRIDILKKKVQALKGKLAEKDSTIATFTNAYLSEVMGYAVVEYGTLEKKEESVLQ